MPVIKMEGIENCQLGVIFRQEVMTLTNQSISDGQQHCFAATETIVVGGDGNQATIESGGQARFVAGQLFCFLPGTKVEGGGYMLAGINQGGNFCDPLEILVAKTEKEIAWKASYQASISSESLEMIMPKLKG